MPPPARPDRVLLLVLAAAAALLLWRGGSMAVAHSESYDDEYHLVHGAAYFRGGLHDAPQPDPPLGQALTALPMVLTNANPRWTGTLYDHSRPPETVLFLTALWRSLLFLPAVGVAFAWCRRLYGLPAGCLAAALLVVEPNFAAHIPLAALDALGVAGALLGSFLLWRAFERPSFGRGAGAAAGGAVALLLKGTTILLPVVAAAYAVLFWIVRPWRAARASPEQPNARKEAGTPSTWVSALPRRLAALVGFAALGFLILWALLLFDVSRPDQPPDWQQAPTLLSRLLDRPLPAGLFFESLVRGAWHADQGHLAYLLGERSRGGWWYYFPVVMAYKTPLGVALVFLLALLSLRSVRPRFEEWGLAIPAILWTALFLTTRINIGVRHFLPAYVFLLLLGARALAGDPPRWRALGAWIGFGLTAIHGLMWHPDYIAYENLPRPRAYLDLSDSNVDWGQGLKQARDWIDAHPQPAGRPISLLYFGDPNSPRRVLHYLGNRVSLIPPRAPLPADGLLIVSPVWVAGPFDIGDRYKALRGLTPVDVIGHALLVYDLAPLSGGGT
ncbi:MAG TPA: glycosyltransferase family 39 protein [Candidatus Polarisedimenticolia bacterium]|jgi:hypothetical protein|nr:glycosyltransferase family 39 protein [Candidatus Polarisedimenticolia bacterium]